MKSIISKTFRRLQKNGKKAFIPYIMAGDPDLERTREVISLFEECGADIVELGVPFTDPLADGPTIQHASERALKNGVTLRKVISKIKGFRHDIKIPIVLMTYYNPVFKYGVDLFFTDAQEAGINGVIVPDLLPDEAADFISLAKKAHLDTIFLLAPTSTDERIKKVSRASTGFIYYVSITGITGASLFLDESMEVMISKIKKFTQKPIAVGFGVSTPEEASAVARLSDGIIVGSAIVKRLHHSPDSLKEYLTSLREAIP